MSSCYTSWVWCGALASDRWLSVSGPVRLITSTRKREWNDWLNWASCSSLCFMRSCGPVHSPEPHFMVSFWKEVCWHTKWREWIESTPNNRGHTQPPSSKSSAGIGCVEDGWTSGGKVGTAENPSVKNWQEWGKLWWGGIFIKLKKVWRTSSEGDLKDRPLPWTDWAASVETVSSLAGDEKWRVGAGEDCRPWGRGEDGHSYQPSCTNRAWQYGLDILSLQSPSRGLESPKWVWQSSSPSRCLPRLKRCQNGQMTFWIFLTWYYLLKDHTNSMSSMLGQPSIGFKQRKGMQLYLTIQLSMS